MPALLVMLGEGGERLGKTIGYRRALCGDIGRDSPRLLKVQGQNNRFEQRDHLSTELAISAGLRRGVCWWLPK